jgi:DNA-binding NtrC family response regulator
MGNHKTAIIIDDDGETVESFVQFLKRFNVETLAVAFNGLTVNELYRKHRPDVVFLDLIMPEHDGFVTCKKLKDEFPDAKVIVITAHLDVEITEKLVNLQPFGILPKPFEANKAMLLIQRLNLAVMQNNT